MKSTIERARNITRTTALMRELGRRVADPDRPEASTSHYYFAGIYDGLLPDDPGTQDSNKWRGYFNGDRPLSAKLLSSLCKTSVWSDAGQLYRDGPANLWCAMWGALNELRSVVVSELAEWRTLDRVLAEFEADLLLAEQEHAPLRLSHLAKTVALYRLHVETNEIVPLSLDGAGICRCLRLCLDNDQMHHDLDSFGIRHAVDDELRMWIATRSGLNVAPSSASARWDAIARNLDWVD